MWERHSLLCIYWPWAGTHRRGLISYSDSETQNLILILKIGITAKILYQVRVHRWAPLPGGGAPPFDAPSAKSPR